MIFTAIKAALLIIAAILLWWRRWGKQQSRQRRVGVFARFVKTRPEPHSPDANARASASRLSTKNKRVEAPDEPVYEIGRLTAAP